MKYTIEVHYVVEIEADNDDAATLIGFNWCPRHPQDSKPYFVSPEVVIVYDKSDEPEYHGEGTA